MVKPPADFIPSAPPCTEATCPGVILKQKHVSGDNECGYLYDRKTGARRPKQRNNPTTCRRPFCSKEFMTKEDRLKHETDPKPHRKADMDFICDWEGHADAIAEHRFCPVCQ